VNAQQDELLDESATALALKVKPQTLSVWRMTGRYGLPFVRVGRSIRYRKSDIDAWLASRVVTPGRKSEVAAV
jgi:excisionase family DNA binding protein